jgi:hypothetical protein
MAVVSMLTGFIVYVSDVEPRHQHCVVENLPWNDIPFGSKGSDCLEFYELTICGI